MKSNFAILVFWFPVNDLVFGAMDRLILDQFHRSLVVPTQKLIAHRRKMNIIPVNPVMKGPWTMYSQTTVPSSYVTIPLVRWGLEE